MKALIVDDDDLSLEMLQNVLAQMNYEVEVARNGRQAMEMLRNNPVHLVITDWEMPELDGLELCRRIRCDDFDGYVYIIMLTAQDSQERKIEGLFAGADSFLTKPLNPAELLVSLKTAQRILSLETRDLAMFALAKLAESRDPETGAHIERVQSYSRLLARCLAMNDQFKNEIDAEFVSLIYQTSPLHDIGKVGIPDSVLLKPGKLSSEEFEVMKKHTDLGGRTLEAALERFPNAKFLQMARDVALSHHEKYDGTGYPRGLAADQIPLCARIVTLADVYDALTSRRVYKSAMSHNQARNIILEQRARHFDPGVVDAFLATEKEFITIGQRLRDSEDATPAHPSPPPLPAPAQAVEVNRQILLVDDDPVQLEFLQRTIEQAGYTALLANGGEEALALLRQHHPRIVISDWAMPDLDGLELCRRIRAMNDAPYVYLVLLTIHAAKQNLVQAFDAGVDDFVAKPIEEVAVLARVRTGIRAVQMHDEQLKRTQGSQAINEQLNGLNERLEKLAITDDLTGLFNRRHAMQRLQENWSTADRYKRPLSIMVVDIDGFKQINDTHGHPAGDAVLQYIALVLRQTARITDTVCRLGGDEFLIICPAETAPDAVICAERLRTAVASSDMPVGQQRINVTVSIGVATRHPGMTESNALLREGDEALYCGKRDGRNRVAASPAASADPLRASA